MIRIITRRSLDVQYLLDDRAQELNGVRDGPALWHPVGQSVAPEEVLTRSTRSPTTGFDLIVAAPRPISVLLAVGTPEEQVCVVRAHRDAVQASLDYLNRRAVVIHRQILGDREDLNTQWDRSASFTHGVNRAGEPHLHDHVLVGSRGAHYEQIIDASVLRDHASSADALYRSHLRRDLNEGLDRDVWQSFAGRDYVSGIDEAVRALWPGRANDHGDKVMWSRDEIMSQWSRDLANYHAGPEVAPTARDGLEFDRHRFSAALSYQTLIRRRDVVASLADAHGRGAIARDIDATVDRAMPELSRDRDHAITRARLREIVVVAERVSDREVFQRSRERGASLSIDRSRDR